MSGFLVNTGEKLILVDTGSGGHWFAPVLGKLAGNLVASGYRPDQVDLVLVTHLHADHAAGITSHGKRVFPNADVLGFPRRMQISGYLRRLQESAEGSPRSSLISPARSPHPTLQPANGAHSRGSTARNRRESTTDQPGIRRGIRVAEFTSKDQKMLVWGDVVHLAPVQLPKPEIAIAFDIDSPAAVKARQALFKELAANKTLIAGAHMPFPGIGRLRVDGKGYEWCRSTT